MDKKLKELAESYLESRNNSIKYMDNSAMMQTCNEAANHTRQRALDLGYTEEDWNDAVQLVWDQQQNKKGSNK